MICTKTFFNIGIDIIDIHMHPFINEKENFCIYTSEAVSGADTIKDDMTRCGISRFCGSVKARTEPNYNWEFKDIKRLNQIALDAKNIFGDMYIPGIHIHPKFINESIYEVKRMYDNGVRLIGELVPYLTGWKYEEYEKEFLEILNVVDNLNMVVSIDGHPESRVLDKVVESFPNTTFIAAHPNEFNLYDAQLERMKKYKNLYLDLSGLGLFRYGMLKHGVNMLGSERFLFGSDYPVCSPGMNIGGILYEKLSSEDYENIFYKNATRLLNL